MKCTVCYLKRINSLNRREVVSRQKINSGLDDRRISQHSLCREDRNWDARGAQTVENIPNYFSRHRDGPLSPCIFISELSLTSCKIFLRAIYQAVLSLPRHLGIDLTQKC